MPFYREKKEIYIESCGIYCDGECGKYAHSLDAVHEGTIVKSSDDWGGCRPVFIMPGVPLTAEDLLSSKGFEGWKKVVIHGKTLYFCQECSLK